MFTTALLLGLLTAAGLTTGFAQDEKTKGKPGRPAAGQQPGQAAGPRFDAQRFLKDHDTNKDGKLSKDELPAAMQAGLAEIDANKDGQISAEELQQHAARMAQQRPEVVEILYYVIDVPEQEPASVQELQQAYDVLRKLDKNNDGKIDPEAVTAYRHQRSEERCQSIIANLDRNKDGKIGKDEARGLFADNFARLDKNGDGFLDKGEIEQACHVSHQGQDAPAKAGAPSEKK